MAAVAGLSTAAVAVAAACAARNAHAAAFLWQAARARALLARVAGLTPAAITVAATRAAGDTSSVAVVGQVAGARALPVGIAGLPATTRAVAAARVIRDARTVTLVVTGRAGALVARHVAGFVTGRVAVRTAATGSRWNAGCTTDFETCVAREAAAPSYTRRAAARRDGARRTGGPASCGACVVHAHSGAVVRTSRTHSVANARWVDTRASAQHLPAGARSLTPSLIARDAASRDCTTRFACRAARLDRGIALASVATKMLPDRAFTASTTTRRSAGTIFGATTARAWNARATASLRIRCACEGSGSGTGARSGHGCAHASDRQSRRSGSIRARSALHRPASGPAAGDRAAAGAFGRTGVTSHVRLRRGACTRRCCSAHPARCVGAKTGVICRRDAMSGDFLRARRTGGVSASRKRDA
jgi:hypothetical protein